MSVRFLCLQGSMFARFKVQVRPEDNFKHYSYVLLYVDDWLCIHHSAQEELNKIDEVFKMKPGSIGDPDIDLGANVKKMEMPNGVEAWDLSTSKCVQEAVRNCEEGFKEHFPKREGTGRFSNPFPTDSDPDLNISEKLDAGKANYFQAQN